jgi:hypothetical protein
MKESVKRKIEQLEKRAVQKALGLDNSFEVQRALAELEQLRRQEERYLTPAERIQREQEDNEAVLEWYKKEHQVS